MYADGVGVQCPGAGNAGPAGVHLLLFVCFLPLLWLGSQINGISGLMSGALVGNLFAGAMAYSFYRSGMARLKAEVASGKA